MSLGQIRSTLCAIAIATLALSMSRVVLAGTCGDYLQHKTTTPAAPIVDDSLPTTPKPCNGPRCSQAPSHPASVPMTVPSVPDETRSSIALLDVESQELATLAQWLHWPSGTYLFVTAEDIFHPPRVG